MLIAFFLILGFQGTIPVRPQLLVDRPAEFEGQEIVLSGTVIATGHGEYIRLPRDANGDVPLLNVVTPSSMVTNPSRESRQLDDMLRSRGSADAVLRGTFHSAGLHYGQGGAFRFELRLTQVMSVRRSSRAARPIGPA